MSDFIVRNMKECEVQFAIDWAQKEGWNLGLNDASSFYQADKTGFFIGLLDNKPVAVGSSVIYDDHFAFCGLYIVKKEYRKRGFGLLLTEERLKHAGNRVTGIDGVLENVHKYERLGYVPFYKQIRYVWDNILKVNLHPKIVDIKTLSFDQVCKYDQKIFLASRINFLKAWINQTNSFACAYVDDGNILGYGVIRKCLVGHKIGPLFAESETVAKALLEHLGSKIQKGPIFIDTPEINQSAQLLVKDYKMTPKFEVIRMYRNGKMENPINSIYGVTTFELG